MDRESLRERLRLALRRSMKGRDEMAVRVLRSTLGAIDNAEAVRSTPHVPLSEGPIAGALKGLGAGEAQRRELTEQDLRQIVEDEVTDCLQAASDYEKVGQKAAAADLREQAALLRSYLA